MAAPPAKEVNQLPSDDYAKYEKEDKLLLLSTSKQGITIRKDTLPLDKQTYLVYAEHVKLVGDIVLPGKDLVLCCSNLTVEKKAKIDVSRENGLAGSTTVGTAEPASEKGKPFDTSKTTSKTTPKTTPEITPAPEKGNGKDGQKGGNVFLFVQDLKREALKGLTVSAYGGDGGLGGDVSEPGQTGGAGGKGGDAGDIEFLYGTRAMTAMSGFRESFALFWPEKCLGFLNGYFCKELTQYVTEHRETLEHYYKLADTLRKIAQRLTQLGDSPQVIQARLHIEKSLKSKIAPKSVSDSLNNRLNDFRSKIEAWDGINPQADIDSVLSEIATDDESQLAGVLGDIRQRIQIQLDNCQYEARGLCTSNHGAGGMGGTSGTPGMADGSSGKPGAYEGDINVRNLGLDGRQTDLEASRPFAFPDQCQMLLGQANELFFLNTDDSRQSASDVYRSLISRLAFLDTISEDRTASKVEEAYNQLETKWKITMSPLAHLHSVYGEAKSRQNRLMLGQNMFGNGPNWVPRLSFIYYQNSVDKQLPFLQQQEELTQSYEAARRSQTKVEINVDKAVESLNTNKQTADDHIRLLTDRNGPINTLAYKITAFTPEMRAKKAEIKKKLEGVSFSYSWDPKLVIDGLSMVTSLDVSVKSLLKATEYGYKAYKSTTIIKNDEDKDVKKDYVINQITTCGETIQSLMESFNTKKDDTLELDDPGATKILTGMKSLRKIMDEFSEALGDTQRKAIKASLDNYVEAVLARNNAVVEYNAAVQQLQEARKNQKYYTDQMNSATNNRLDIDPELPVVTFWLRNMRNNLRTSMMQYLEYERQSIRFWGLEEGGLLSFSSSSMKMNYSSLRDWHRELSNAFDRSLGWYAGNIRAIWPHNKTDLGTLYELTPAELDQLRRRSPDPSGDHSVTIRLDPTHTKNIFRGQIDTRLKEVRVWLLGAEMPQGDEIGRKKVVIQLTHFGNEVVLDNAAKEIQFAHECVNMQFSYDMAEVAELQQAKESAIFSSSGLEQDFTVGSTPTQSSLAPVGPYTTWKIQVRQDANPGIRMDGLRKAYIEFRGSNRSRT